MNRNKSLYAAQFEKTRDIYPESCPSLDLCFSSLFKMMVIKKCDSLFREPQSLFFTFFFTLHFLCTAHIDHTMREHLCFSQDSPMPQKESFPHDLTRLLFLQNS